jgi:hypothetical protein
MPPTSSKLHSWILARKQAGRSSEQIADELAAKGIRPPEEKAPYNEASERANLNLALQAALYDQALLGLKAAGAYASSDVEGVAELVAAEVLPPVSDAVWRGLQGGGKSTYSMQSILQAVAGQVVITVTATGARDAQVWLKISGQVVKGFTLCQPQANPPPAVPGPSQAQTRTEIEYEVGPDGKQRPKAITTSPAA